jgi:chemotaxis protein methyltransferase CheR
MVLDDCRGGRPWEVFGSDISLRVLERARRGHYPEERTTRVPPPYLRRYCLRGIGPQAGTVLVDRNLRQRVQFLQINLNTTLPRLGTFDVIFLRNVMIYFNGDTKRQVVGRVLATLKPGGYFFIGHSENLNGISDTVTPTAPSIYRKG